MVIRPPYFENEDSFYKECIECSGDCATFCEENIIKIAKDKTPYIVFGLNGCTYCDECALACEYDVLKVENISHLNAIITINKDKCVSWHHTMCFSCKDPCLDKAIDFKAMFMPSINDNCTACGECEKVCQGERVSEFDFGLRKTKAIYLPFPMAFPLRYVLDKDALAPGDLERIMSACKYNAIDPDMKEEEKEFEVGAIIWATGWKPYDATKLDNLGFGKYANVITNMQMERLASPWGPTGGRIIRPSDKMLPKRVAFVQCAGSRDENHLPYCSYICCLASLKHSLYLAQQDPETEILIFYIDFFQLYLIQRSTYL